MFVLLLGLAQAAGLDCVRTLDEGHELVQARKPLAASHVLVDLIDSAACPEQEAEAHLLVGQALMDLEMFHSAEHHLLQVLRQPPGPMTAPALSRLLAVSRVTEDSTTLRRVVHRIPEDHWPRRGEDELRYLMALRLLDRGELSEAREQLARVDPHSRVGDQALYLHGLVLHQQERPRSAAQTFLEVGGEGRAQDLALLGVGRIGYAYGQYELALQAYGELERDSELWPDALFERSYVQLRQHDLSSSLGDLLALKSPHFEEGVFLPERHVLEAIALFELCEYGRAEELLLDLEAELIPIEAELDATVRPYASAEGKRRASQATRDWFGGELQDTELPKALFLRFLRNRDLAGLLNHLALLDEEEERILAQKALWRNGVGQALLQQIESDRTELERRAGLVLLGEMARARQDIEGLIGQSELIRYEIVRAEGQRFETLVQQPGADRNAERQIDYAVEPDWIHWPFNGEFWWDELGGYRVVEPGSCLLSD